MRFWFRGLRGGELVFVIRGIEVGFLSRVLFQPLPALVPIYLRAACGRELAIESASNSGVLVWVVALHLVVPEDKVLEGVDVVDFGEAVAVGLDEVDDEGFDVFALDEFKELEAGGVEEVVARDGVVDDLEDGGEEVVFDDLGIVEFVLEVDALAKKFDCGWRESICGLYIDWRENWLT